MEENFRTGVLRFTPMETICRRQMLLNLYPPQAGTGGPAARPYPVGAGHCLFDRLDGDAVQGRGVIRKPLTADR